MRGLKRGTNRLPNHMTDHKADLMPKSTDTATANHSTRQDCLFTHEVRGSSQVVMPTQGNQVDLPVGYEEFSKAFLTSAHNLLNPNRSLSKFKDHASQDNWDSKQSGLEVMQTGSPVNA